MSCHDSEIKEIDSTTVIIIDFNSAARTIKYIQDFRKFSQLKYPHFVVVDNSCNENNLDVLIEGDFCKEKTEFDGNLYLNRKCLVAVYEATANEGFAKGNNIGFKIAKKIFDDQIIVFSNNDIIFDETFDFSLLVKIILNNKKIAAIGPKIVGVDGRNQTPYIYQNIYERWIFPNLLWPLNKLLLRKKTDIVPLNQCGSVYRLLGAFMVVSASVFEEINGFDENTFLYAEELILSERLSKMNYETYYCPDVTLVHEGGFTTKKSMYSIERLQRRFVSEIYYFKTYRHVHEFTINLAKLSLAFFVLKKKIIRVLSKKVK